MPFAAQTRLVTALRTLQNEEPASDPSSFCKRQRVICLNAQVLTRRFNPGMAQQGSWQ